jgi:4'-phosphopantetheinyl transferase
MSAAWEAGPENSVAPRAEVHVWRAELGPVGARERRPAARRAMRRVLARYMGGAPSTIELAAGGHGKPALCGPAPPLHFNLSHSGEVALVAVAREREVGVDVELVDGERDLLRLAEVGLDAEEEAAVRSAPPGARAAAFYAAWVRKEAVAKCLGVGLGVPLPSRPVRVSELDAGAGYAAAVAVSGSEQMPLRRLALPAAG